MRCQCEKDNLCQNRLELQGQVTKQKQRGAAL